MSPILTKQDKILLKKGDFTKVPDLLQYAPEGIIILNGDKGDISDFIKKRGTGIYKRDRVGSCGIIIFNGRGCIRAQPTTYFLPSHKC
jgi:hypothetical protein